MDGPATTDDAPARGLRVIAADEDPLALERTATLLEHARERRAVIERAKGVLMERHGLDERAAFDRLRAEARNRSMAVVALAAEVNEPG